ncbi:Uncharacterised protein [Segatella copri]|nr:Uncharacterised protein [Segatella copri]
MLMVFAFLSFSTATPFRFMTGFFQTWNFFCRPAPKSLSVGARQKFGFRVPPSPRSDLPR